MALRAFAKLWDTIVGDLTFNAVTAAGIGAVMGNGAFGFASSVPAGFAPMGESGNVGMVTAQPGTSPGSTAADIVMAIISVPAGTLDIAGRALEIFANGSTASNTNSKTVKVIVNATNPVVGSAVVGGTTIATATIATVAGAGGWALAAQIAKYGAAGSNTQQTVHTAAQTGNTVGALAAPSALTLNEAAAINVVVTCNAATTVTDVTFGNLQVVGFN